jgi:hypothetical protein
MDRTIFLTGQCFPAGKHVFRPGPAKTNEAAVISFAGGWSGLAGLGGETENSVEHILSYQSCSCALTLNNYIKKIVKNNKKYKWIVYVIFYQYAKF